MSLEISSGRSPILISGIIIISLAFVGAVVSATAYFFYDKYQEEKLFKLANNTFYATGLLILLASGLLLYNILAHNFQLNYVYSYSSRSLSPFYLFSTFWAGQEGTFLLWLLYGTVFGLILIKTVARKNPLILFFHMLVQGFILLILLKKNPFAMIWQVYQDVPFGFIPADGSGLNPLLQNPWMVIHPPTLFLGYSSTMVLFAFALNAMVKKQFRNWVQYVRSWVVFAVLILGTGIILGGYWAYATLGWGGYWGWDPVENSSLVPWLLSIVLLHGVIIQNRLGGLVKTNLTLAGLTFITVLWGSFLTRSGVLSDFSVHSFAESDLNYYLIAFVGLFAFLFLYYFVKSWRYIESQRFSESLFSRETFIFLGMMIVLFTAIVVLLGTSSPIFTTFFTDPTSVAPVFYNSIGVPIAILILFSVALSPVLAWQVSNFMDKTLIINSLIISILATVIGFVLGITQPASIIMFFLAVLSILINGVVGIRFLRKNVKRAGGFLAHVGLALMFIGIITSSMYDRSEKITLPLGEFQKSSLGYELKFLGFVKMPDGKDRAKVLVKTDYGTYEAYPRFYFSTFTNSYMASPDVKMQLTRDIYISPISFVPGQNAKRREITLKKGGEYSSANLRIKFEKFEVSMGADKPTVKALLSVELRDNNYRKQYFIKPAIWMVNGKMEAESVRIPESDYQVKIKSVDAEAGTVKLELINLNAADFKAKDLLAVEISEKPLINILWFGTFIMMGGLFLTLFYRAKEKFSI